MVRADRFRSGHRSQDDHRNDPVAGPGTIGLVTGIDLNCPPPALLSLRPGRLVGDILTDFAVHGQRHPRVNAEVAIQAGWWSCPQLEAIRMYDPSRKGIPTSGERRGWPVFAPVVWRVTIGKPARRLVSDERPFEAAMIR